MVCFVGKESIISTQETLEDVTSISWSDDIRNGSKKVIIKSNRYDCNEKV